MLGKRTRPLLCTTSKSSLLFANECTRKVDKASGKHSFALPSVHHHIDVGFDIGAEVKPSDACESPRSVLDVNVLPPQKQVTARSLRSCLRRLPLLKKGNQGVGLALIVDIKAEEEEDYGSVSHVDCHALSASAQSHRQQRSQPIAIVGNPQQRDHHSANKDSNYADSSPSHSQSHGASSVPSVLDFFGSDVMSPWQDCVVDNQVICVTEIDEDYTVHQPIFSVSSIPSNYCSVNIRSMSFLEACFLCQHAFSPGKDIFMYRGDQAFCSAECRGKQMKIDDYKEKNAVMALLSHRHALSGLT